jgi:hypothetical protein
MRPYSLSHVSDPELLRGLVSLLARDRATTASLLAHLAEMDSRRLYLPAAHPSMHSYCVHELRLSEDAAYKRIQAARAARRFPAIFEAVADGRLHLTAVLLLAPYLTAENADDLLAAAAHKTKSEIEGLLARRFPHSETLGLVEALPASAPGTGELSAPGRIDVPGPEGPEAPASQLAPERVGTHARLAPVATERFLLQLTIGKNMQEKLRYAQDLLGHQLPGGDVAQVLDRALDALIEKLERRKFAATPRPRRSHQASADPRHIPAHVRRAVWERDGGQCTFVSDGGQRCAARRQLEFDHVQEVARGGEATVAGIRLRCRARNQYEAECTFGAEFMRHKREEARRRAEARRQGREARATDEARRKAEETRARAAAEEVITPLRVLGFTRDEARRAAKLCEEIPDASLEQRVRRALTYLRPPVRTSAHVATRAGCAP